jgi:hypothetical protein
LIADLLTSFGVCRRQRRGERGAQAGGVSHGYAVRAGAAFCACLATAGKRGRVVDGEFGEALPIEPDTGGLQAADQMTIGEGRADARRRCIRTTHTRR